MTTILNAVSGTGFSTTADGSGIVKLQSNGVTTNALAWVNFNGVTTVTVKSSYNISSVTRSGAGFYVVNFTNNLSDANYAVIGTGEWTNGVTSITVITGKNSTNTVSSAAVQSTNLSSSPIDSPIVSVVIFGN